jgi:muramoyltetrapeptide carboxypeptidase
MLTQLWLSGLFKGLAGIVFGELIHCDAQYARPPRYLEGKTVVIERLARLNIPFVLGAPVGHGRHNHALPLGLQAVLDADAGTLSFPSPLTPYP